MTETEAVSRSTVTTTINPPRSTNGHEPAAGDAVSHHVNGHKQHDELKTIETTTPSTPTTRTATLPPRAGTVNSDKVLLHAWPRSPAIPHLSPFVLKLETWLRMANIPYELTTEQPLHSKTSKMPWIEYLGEQMYDSQVIIDTLSQKAVGRRNLDSNLDPRERAVARAFQKMIDEHTVLAVPVWRYLRDPEGRIWSPTIFPNMGWKAFLMKPLIRRSVDKSTYAQGIGRMDDGIFQDVIKRDLKAISDYLGDNPYLMGDTPNAADASLFGMTAQFLWVDAPTSPFQTFLKESTPNLVQHAERMKTEYFPDWNELVATSPNSSSTATPTTPTAKSSKESFSAGSTLTKKEKTPKKSKKYSTDAAAIVASGSGEHHHKIHDVENQPIINTASPGYVDHTATTTTTTTTVNKQESNFNNEIPITPNNKSDAAMLLSNNNDFTIEKQQALSNGNAVSGGGGGGGTSSVDVGGAGDIKA